MVMLGDAVVVTFDIIDDPDVFFVSVGCLTCWSNSGTAKPGNHTNKKVPSSHLLARSSIGTRGKGAGC